MRAAKVSRSTQGHPFWACDGHKRRRRCLLLWVGLLLGSLPALAGGPRFIPGQGPGWNVPSWSIVAWPAGSLPYFTDPGPLSATVTHAQADAMVATAAAVWNVPSSSIALTQGGTLAEDVSTANTIVSGTAVALPADVQPGNETNIPVAILYDADGGLIDLLLGPGASDPDSCQTNAVIGDVDDIYKRDGIITHATLILNGRCVGDAPEQLLEMQYQLVRAFGRVLGLSWSQTNDVVFTAQQAPSAQQMAFWPLMHPLDLICGNYTYQCLTNPFTLRADDLNTLAQLYPVYSNAVPQGKEATDGDAMYLRGQLVFPTGQGMEWVNITSHRRHGAVTEGWQTTSGMSGFEYTQGSSTPLGSSSFVDSGLPFGGLDAFFIFRRVPLDGISDVFFEAEAINPLYMGESAVGPYVRFPVSPSGSSALWTGYSALPAGDSAINIGISPAGAASVCNPGLDGSEAAPATPDATGWQTGQTCAWGHTSWWSVPVAAGHTWTLEVTATDETGAASLSKAMPVMGVWQATDATGILPTVAMAPVAFNSMAFGLTQLPMAALGNDTVYRVSVGDQYGAGRPDFSYVARILSVDHVLPAAVGTVGGQVSIIGTGFRPGMTAWVNGVQALVVRTSGTEIVANIPAMATAGAPEGVPMAVMVLDPETAGSASAPAALRYIELPDQLQEISAPTAVETGLTAATTFAVRIVRSDGWTPVAGASVQLTATTATATLDLCAGQASCTAITDVNGVVQSTVRGMAPGAGLLTASALSGTANVQASLVDTDPIRAVTLNSAAHYLAAGVVDSWAWQFEVAQDGQPLPGVAVAWTVDPQVHVVTEDASTSGSLGAQLQVSTSGLLPNAAVTVSACAWTAVCAEATVYAVDPALWTPTTSPSAAQSISVGSTFQSFQVLVTDGAGHPVEQAPVQVYQRALGWQGACTTARCPAAPVLAATQTALTTDGNGLINITPLEVAGVPQTVEIAVATGTQGFLTLTLVKAP